MTSIKQILVCITLPIAMFGQNSSSDTITIRDTVFWKTTFHIVPQKFDTNFTIDDAVNCLKKLKNKVNDYYIWIAFYKIDPTKIAFVGYVDAKENKFNAHLHNILTEGWIASFSTLTSKKKKAFGIHQYYREAVSYINGKRVGYSNFYSNGKTERTEMYDILEMKDGNWKYYDESGKLIKTVKYKNGQVIN